MVNTLRYCQCGRILLPARDNVVPMRCEICHNAVRLIHKLEDGRVG